MNSIILLSGPIGAGKTTVARELVATAGGRVACIEGDVFWSFIQNAKANQRGLENFKTIMRAMVRAASAFARDGFEVILDFSIPPKFVDAARAKIKEVTVDYVVLLPSREICAARAAARPQGTIADYTQYDEFYECFKDARRYTICNDDLDPATAAFHIREGLKAGKYRVAAASVSDSTQE